ncbi:polyprenyl synthetase family protein [Desulforudis sp. 1088]|uniref:polyprenyl synthetase family protein n=1 Tax=unclassified Candidatus Desulforudis TaxID=2635950 RepID=UPI003CE50D9C
MNFLDRLAEKRYLVDAALDRYLPGADVHPAVIHEAMRYSVFAGGKRLRPAMTLAACEAVGGDPGKAMAAACAFELIHTYSLVHDDLPAMDDDDLRRGRPTSHKVYGEALAILVGDALLTLGFGLLGRSVREHGCLDGNALGLVEDVAEACSTMGLIGGQVMDIQSTDRQADPAELEYIHRTKTGALFRAAVRAGCILGGGSGQQLKQLTAFAEHFGLVFQITDDILDVVGDEKVIGKPVGSDTRNRKLTYVSLFGLDEARARARREAELALSALQGFDTKADFLRQAVQFVLTREF